MHTVMSQKHRAVKKIKTEEGENASNDGVRKTAPKLYL